MRMRYLPGSLFPSQESLGTRLEAHYTSYRDVLQYLDDIKYGRMSPPTPPPQEPAVPQTLSTQREMYPAVVHVCLSWIYS